MVAEIPFRDINPGIKIVIAVENDGEKNVIAGFAPNFFSTRPIKVILSRKRNKGGVMRLVILKPVIFLHNEENVMLESY